MFQFILKPGSYNTKNCDGLYILDESKGNVNNKPVYVNHTKGRILVFLKAVGNVFDLIMELIM